jgi:UDP-N-acetylglucosamine 2-epimerase (non-hydrolysing)
MLQERTPKLFEKIIIVAGARPNFMKIAPLCAELKKRSIPYEVFYSQQHYDDDLCKVFKDQLNLDNGHSANITMTGNSVKDIQKIMGAFQHFLKKQSNVSCVVVVGDVNTTYACAIVTKRFGTIPLIHLESGLRSFDQSMPEEMNRITVDHLSDILLAPSDDAVENLKDEGLSENVYLVGNVMIDCLEMSMNKIKSQKNIFGDLKKKYAVVTFHRPENVDNIEVLTEIFDQLDQVSKEYEIVFPMHPRTMQRIEDFELNYYLDDYKVSKALGYFDFMKVVMESSCVITDSGGIQEETSYLGIPCFTVRKNTERPVTIRLGTNRLIGYKDISNDVLGMVKKQKKAIPFWDGKTAKRIVDVLIKQLCFI